MSNFVLAVCGQKGGVGKTTLAYNFYARVLRDEPSAILIDCDNNQYSSFELSADRKANGVMPDLPVLNMSSEELEKNIVEIARQYKVIIIESGGRIDNELKIAMKLADKVIMPLKASNVDLKTVPNVEAQLAASGNTHIQAIIVPNMIWSESALKALKTVEPHFKYFKFSKTCLRQRSAYVISFDTGRAIFELRPRNIDANLEFENLYKEIFYNETA